MQFCFSFANHFDYLLLTCSTAKAIAILEVTLGPDNQDSR